MTRVAGASRVRSPQRRPVRAANANCRSRRAATISRLASLVEWILNGAPVLSVRSAIRPNGVSSAPRTTDPPSSTTLAMRRVGVGDAEVHRPVRGHLGRQERCRIHQPGDGLAIDLALVVAELVGVARLLDAPAEDVDVERGRGREVLAVVLVPGHRARLVVLAEAGVGAGLPQPDHRAGRIDQVGHLADVADGHHRHRDLATGRRGRGDVASMSAVEM